MKTEEEIIEDEVYEQALRIWGGPRAAREPWWQLPYTYCTMCRDYDFKRPCVCNVVTGEALCCQHWIETRVKERIELLKKQRPPVVQKVNLDVADFSRL